MLCQRRGCEASAVWIPVLELRAPSSDIPATATLQTFGLCKRHKDETKLGDLLTDEGWEMLTSAFAEHGKAMPSRLLTRLLWLPLQ